MVEKQKAAAQASAAKENCKPEYSNGAVVRRVGSYASNVCLIVGSSGVMA